MLGSKWLDKRVHFARFYCWISRTMGGLVRIDANNRYGTIFVTSSCASYFGELNMSGFWPMAILAIWDLYEIYMRFGVIDHVRVSDRFRLWGTVIHDLQATSKARNWEHLRLRKWLDELAQLYQVTILFWILCMDRCYIFLMMFIHVYHLWIAFRISGSL